MAGGAEGGQVLGKVSDLAAIKDGGWREGVLLEAFVVGAMEVNGEVGCGLDLPRGINGR